PSEPVATGVVPVVPDGAVGIHGEYFLERAVRAWRPSDLAHKVAAQRLPAVPNTTGDRPPVPHVAVRRPAEDLLYRTVRAGRVGDVAESWLICWSVVDSE